MPDFEPIYTTTGAESVGRFVATHYALSEPLACRMMNRGFNDVYLVTAAGGDRYVFRLSHHRARGPADVRTETDFLAHLVRCGVPAAAAITTRDGALFVRGEAAEGVREGVLFRSLDGRTPDPACPIDARATGVTLARLHDAASSHRAEAPLYQLDLDHLLRRPLARVQQLCRDIGADDGGVLAEIAARTAERIEAVHGLTWTHCHGDCHGRNARINDSGEAVFFDFDDGGPGYLAYDIAVFLWAMHAFGRRLPATWRAFVDGYRSVRPISAADFETAHAFVIVRHLWVMGEHASRSREWGSEPVRWITREREFLEGWEAEHLADRLL
ncbi:aminoglycoside phosphotransferase [Bradyrhizobium sp. SSBR45G]|uniref:phosphotransferase enzyme family protein n=1 Tax=unclassified Bradyrhizobium TaxID=2631580 RepID=UPI0023429236|nr:MULTISPECIES: phosphotransferase [unclassified Bradyrhizobium]GLH82412.1 aminoglycoside phosphotransferase [Bradyrhizobium sp. SSBR45G]GLH89826.1 aminoglycoside phosphotransferase [Bradyrhizobium sp. SSBR45R]